LNSHSTLISIGQFDLKFKHLLIIGILSLSFSISFLIRSQPADWGWELNEFDPFFNYRATEYFVENGFDAYFQWHDDMSWYPDGRNVSQTSQVVLHFTATILYWIFGSGGSLYDFTILFPVIFGSLTCIVIFALVRVIGGTTAGLFASLLFSISLPIIIRGQIGWFKSEPLGLFFAILTLYLFLSGIKSHDLKISIPKMIFSGLFLILSISAWGGDKFFLIPIAIFCIVLPFLRKDHKFLIYTIPLFTISALIGSLGFERLGINFIIGTSGLTLIFPTIFLIICSIIQHKSKETHKTRNGLILLLGTIIILSSFAYFVFVIDPNFIPIGSYRYLNSINPFLTTTDPLVDSISEHATTTLSQSFLFHSILMPIAGLGIWLILRNQSSKLIKNDMIIFLLIFGISGIYVSSTFVRLEVFGSLSIIALSSVGLSILCKEFFISTKEIKQSQNRLLKSSFVFGIVFLLLIPLILPSDSTIFALTDNPPTILNGGTLFDVTTSDWNDSMYWIKNNTPPDSVIASWWDYGYWIQTKGERTSIVDNATLSHSTIEKIAKLLLSTPDEGWKSLESMGADYFVVHVAGQRLTIDGSQNQPIYNLGGGGDESKKQWFMKIAHEPLGKYIHPDGISGTEIFWNETLLGKMIPFEPIGYVNFQTEQQSLTYQHGFTTIYQKSIKFSENDPMKLVYSSPSFDTEKGGNVIGVFVYEINHGYIPEN